MDERWDVIENIVDILGSLDKEGKCDSVHFVFLFSVEIS